MERIGYNNNMKIGIFGGVFDPVHSEHLKIIQKSREELCLDRLIILPSYCPPHKKTRIAPFEIRVKMLKAATIGLDYVIIDEREHNSNKDKNCAFEILQSILSDYKNDELVYIIGGDSMISFHTWVHPEIVASLIPIAVVAREGYKNLDIAIKYAQNKYGAKIELLPFSGEEVSSSQIKATYELGKVSDMIDPKVSDIIIEERLYSYFGGIVKKLKESITDELFEHSAGTVIYAIKQAGKLNLDYEEVFIATLLHDCAKLLPIADNYKNIPPKIVHQFAGADRARLVFDIKNDTILDAIRYHTTGKKSMSRLGKLVYCADMVEHNRDFEGVETLRNELEKDFDRGFIKCIEASMKKLQNNNRDIFYLTQECWEFYNNSV